MQPKILLITVIIVSTLKAQAQNATPFWSLGGNSNATPSSKLGTTNYTPLLLRTNNLSRIYIAPDGKIGIGTTSPTTQFHVEGQTLLNIFVNTVAPGLQSGSGLIGYVKGQPTAAGQRLGYFLMGSQGGGTDPYNATGMVGYADGAWNSTSRPGYLAFETTNPGTKQRAEAIRITSDGRVGVGTGAPFYRLHSVDVNVAMFAEGQGGSSYGLIAGGGYIAMYAYTLNASAYAGYFSGNVYATGTYTGSDKKLKRNISEFSDALTIIKKLKPRTYEYLTEGKMSEMNLPKGKHYGLIAQDIESVLPDLVKETPMYPRRDSTSGSKSSIASVAGQETFKAVNYTELIPILVKGMQEQDADKEGLKQVVQEQNEKLVQMQAEIRELKAMLTNNTIGSVSSASLEVPVPNPAKGNTNIRYSIPTGAISARLTVVNMLGQVMKEVRLSGGAGQVNLNVSGLAAGTYPCTLWVNGQKAVSNNSW